MAERRSRSWALLPNSLTAANLALGFLSILHSLRAQAGLDPDPAGAFYAACWLILWATIFDGLDGRVAKLTGTTSDFGMRLDTFADGVTFGVAPAALVYGALLRGEGTSPLLALFGAGAYAMAALFRLARFNVSSQAAPRFGFVGLPTPAAALICVSFYLSTRQAPPSADLAAVFLALLAIAMVSPLRYPDFKGLRGREKTVVLFIFTTMLGCAMYFGVAKVLLISFGSFALVWGWWWIPLRHLWVPGVKKGD